MTAARILTEAAQLIDRQGFHRGSLEHPDTGAVCALGAILRAAWPDDPALDDRLKTVNLLAGHAAVIAPAAPAYGAIEAVRVLHAHLWRTLKHHPRHHCLLSCSPPETITRPIAYWSDWMTADGAEAADALRQAAAETDRGGYGGETGGADIPTAPGREGTTE